MKYIKRCITCDKEFKESDFAYTLNMCDVCTGELIEEEVEDEIEEIEEVEDEIEEYAKEETIELKQEDNYEGYESYEYECEECGCTYASNLEACEVCGEPNPNPRQINIEDRNITVNKIEESILGDFVSIDSLGYIHIIDKTEDTKYNNLDRLKIYINDKVYKTVPIKFNEITVGRNSLRFIPTYDLSEIDPENYISRKHLMLYREQGNVYARNLSSKNTIHINGKLLLENENKVLNHNDELILSGYIVTKFLKGDI